MSIPKAIQHDLDAKALRSTLWLCIYFAQTLGLTDVTHELTAIRVAVDERLDAGAVAA